MKTLKTLILLLLLFGNIILFGQMIRHAISVPLLTYQLASIPNSFKNEINENYFNNFYLPNFRYDVTLKDKFVIGLEHYYFFRESQARPDASITQIRALQIKSYSFLLGINTYESLKLNIKIGTGVSYHDSWIGKYLVNDPTVINDNPCYKSNKISPVLWSSLDYFYEKNFFFRLNIRLNPMLRPFASEQGIECNVSQIHNRISYGLAQLALGYRF